MKWKEPKDYKEVNGYILVKKYYHKSMGECEAIPNSHIKGDYEIIHVDKETKDAFYGMPLEGLGLVDCMCLKSDCRSFTDKEWEYWGEEHSFGMYGSHSGNLSYTFKVKLDNNLLKESDKL